MSSPGGGKNKLNLQTFKDLQTTPKILFIVALTISILGLIGAIIGATAIKSNGGKAAAGLVGGGVCAGTAYWAYSIFTDKKNLKTCNVSLWSKDSTYMYNAPSREPDAKNVSECDAKKMAEYDNSETKWFLTRPNASVSSNVDVWFFTEKTVAVSCTGPCTLYTSTATTTSRKVDTPTRTGCSPTGGGSGGNRSPGSAAGGGGGGGGSCGGPAVNDFPKGSSPGPGCASAPNCSRGIRGSCCTTNDNCATVANVALTCNPTITSGSLLANKCCDPGTKFSEGCHANNIGGGCTTGGENSCCGIPTDCSSGNTCIKATTGASTGKCCPPNKPVLGADGNCSTGLDGAACAPTNNPSCGSGKSCVQNVSVNGATACCPSTPSGYVWDPSGGLNGTSVVDKCLALNGRSAGDKCSANGNGSECSSNRCERNPITGDFRCGESCPASSPTWVPGCNSCVNRQNGSCCGIHTDCDSGNCAKEGSNLTGKCCPSGEILLQDGCVPLTGRALNQPCNQGPQCNSGNCWGGLCRLPGYNCDTAEDCGDAESIFRGNVGCSNNKCWNIDDGTGPSGPIACGGTGINRCW